MDGTGVKEIAGLAPRPVPVVVGGITHVLVSDGQNGWRGAGIASPDAWPAPLAVNTLTGLVEYLAANRDKLERETLMVHVSGPDVVGVSSAMGAAPFHQRVEHLAAVSPSVFGGAFRLNQYLDHETFMVGLQTLFDAQGDLATVLQVLGSVKEEKVRTTGDDGVSQSVNVQAGVRLVGETKVPSPIMLAPFRTFREVEQPLSRFILRVKSGPEGGKPSCALFEADGGAWRLAAIKNVSEFLHEKLDALGVTVIA